MWLRPVDVAAALAGRRYSCAGSLLLRVRDRFCPWNECVWQLVVDNEGIGRCRQTNAEPELELTPDALGMVYLGGHRFGTLAKSGLITGSAEALRRGRCPLHLGPVAVVRGAVFDPDESQRATEFSGVLPLQWPHHRNNRGHWSLRPCVPIGPQKSERPAAATAIDAGSACPGPILDAGTRKCWQEKTAMSKRISPHAASGAQSSNQQQDFPARPRTGRSDRPTRDGAAGNEA